MSGPFDYNGGSVMAMMGENCVVMAADRRLGQGLTTIATNFQRVFKMQDNILLGLCGLATDV
jgi:20S proteasome subunit beta 3